MTPFALTTRLHHVGIETCDLANSTAWYRNYFGVEPKWTVEQFSELTRERLPGVSRLTEVTLGELRFHLFERESPALERVDDDRVQFQHLCLAVESSAELRKWRERWITLFESGAYTYLRPELPTEIVVDDDGCESFYCFDVNGLEFELTYVPEGPR